MRLLRGGERRLTIHFAAQKLHRLLVSERRERTSLVAIFVERLSVSSIRPSSNIFAARRLMRAYKSFALRIEPETQNAKALQRIASLPPKFGHIGALRRGPRPGTLRSPGSLWERHWRECGPLPRRSSRRRMRCKCSAPRFSARARNLSRSSSERCGPGKSPSSSARR